MKVRLLSSVGGSPSYRVGEIADLPTAIAQAWIADRIAESTEDVETAVESRTVETAVRTRKRR